MELDTECSDKKWCEVADPPPAYDDTSATYFGTDVMGPQPTTTRSLYFQKPAGPNIVMYVGPYDTRDPASLPWMGILRVKCTNVPELMSSGFHWTIENVQQEEGYYESTSACIDCHPDELRRILMAGWVETRHYFMRDIQHNPPQWVAHFQFHCYEKELLTKIRLEHLAVERIFHAIAQGDAFETIYEFWKLWPDQCFNAIYDDMPLDGWWPWPKKPKFTQEKTNGWLARLLSRILC
ncbi:hypothetical protein GGS26DRAFT_591314 [Hypomontagnella submonticulosa]|nr:hypothetical protein GGS26DRAFT_591314 [Hypomontagnella submonticulosa]